MLHLIDVKCIVGSHPYLSSWIIHSFTSVFSEAFFVGVDALVTKLIDLACLSLCVILDFIAANLHVVASLGGQILRVRPQGERSSESFCCVNDDNGTNR